MSDRRLHERQLQVMNLRAGMWFMWCGRPVRFIKATDHTARNKPRRRLVCMEQNGTEHRLSYEDREQVTVVDPSEPGVLTPTCMACDHDTECLPHSCSIHAAALSEGEGT